MNLNNIKGIGQKTLLLLNNLNIYNQDDLISYYPYRYNFIKRSDLFLANNLDNIIIDGQVEQMPTLMRFKKLDKMTFKINTGSLLLNVVIFNRGYLKNKLLPNTIITIFGKYDKLHNVVAANELRFGGIEKETIEPVYHTTSGISSHQIKSFIDEANEYHIYDIVPSYLQAKYQFEPKLECVKEIHNPHSLKSLEIARAHLKYEELFVYMLKMQYLKNNAKHKIGLKREVDINLINDFISKLPFTLTDDQNKVVAEIYDDLIDKKRMNRLLQGDVGSGKTIVAFISMYINYLSGYQSALMAPTDVLANQHYINLLSIFKNYNLNIVLLTGKMHLKDKKKALDLIGSGQADIIIGTHALISENVIYKNLGLVITDEQHRFGVNQRSSFKNKGIAPDILYMSATPIPRTYTLTLYGDMDVSTIKTMPKGRKAIITSIKKTSETKDVLNSMFDELKNKHQVYVIAPLIEESDKIDLENINDLESKMQRAFGKLYTIGVMHGKMDQSAKDSMMQKFHNNEINILISTTVIEVGVDVANATMIVIFDSFRFGLSTIHQLRGRVGRSDIQSHCILISDHEIERLNILTKTLDGFKISEEDFKLRGSGDLFGIRQSGEQLFKVADIHNDFDLLLKAKEDSASFLTNYANDPLVKKVIKELNDID